MKLQSKLLAAFAIVVLFMGVTQSFFMKTSIESSFEEYLVQQQYGYVEKMKQSLELFYRQNHSWDNVQSLFNQNSPRKGMGRGGMNMSELLFLNEEGMILGDSKGTRLGTSASELQGKKVPIIVDGEKVGELLLYQQRLEGLEQDFLNASNKVIFFSSMIAGVLAIFISIFVAKKMTEPMNRLMAAIRQIAQGKRTKVSIHTKDEFHELGQAFNQMSSELQKIDDARKALVADVAHELRTPLAILQGKLESIQEGAVEATEEVIIGLTDEVYRLNRLVSDLQQLSLAEAGKLPLNKARTELKPLIERICEQISILAEEKGISLLYNDVPRNCIVDIDKDRMTQVIVNIVGNALRHTPEKGVVEVSAHQKKDRIVINIKDSGPGIPKEILPFIFNRFYKRDRSRSRNDGGTGLGLSIAKGYVDAHGGQIIVESEEGVGTKFKIILPS